jgi:hypothetical protein
MQGLPDDCVLDTSRGGGKIDSPYNLSWPPGFDIGFPGETIWRSLDHFITNYDPQRHEASLTVWLHGVEKIEVERFSGYFIVYLKCPS